MRLKLTLHCPPQSRLHLEHAHALRAVIYKIIERADAEYSQFLHEQGFVATGKKNFKLFCYSRLIGQPFSIDKRRDQLVFDSGIVEWMVGFYVDEQLVKFIEGLFHNQVLEVVAANTKVRFQVQGVEILETPVFTETMRFRCETGICITEKIEGNRHEQYRSPDDAGYKELFFNSLASKVQAAMGEMPPSVTVESFEFRVLSAAKKRSTQTPQDNGKPPIRTIGYKYDFEITAPIEWMKVGFASGFGKLGSGGFGFTSVLK